VANFKKSAVAKAADAERHPLGAAFTVTRTLEVQAMATDSISLNALHPEHRRFVELKARVEALGCELVIERGERGKPVFTVTQNGETVVAALDGHPARIERWLAERESTTPKARLAAIGLKLLRDSAGGRMYILDPALDELLAVSLTDQTIETELEHLEQTRDVVDASPPAAASAAEAADVEGAIALIRTALRYVELCGAAADSNEADVDDAIQEAIEETLLDDVRPVLRDAIMSLGGAK
jgi:hypothetical protein